MIGRAYRALRRDNPLVFVARQLEKVLAPRGVSPLSFTRAAGFHANVRSADLKEQFALIHRDRLWDSNESVSGVGSELGYTQHYRRQLVALLQARGFASMFDAPCGDMNWMPAVLEQVTLDYIGGDIVRELVSDNRRRFPQWEFHEFDVTADAFPDAELWHCRDCILHLPNALIWQALERFADSRCTHALISSHRGIMRNVDIPAGGGRYVDLTRAPFHFEPAEALLEGYRRGIDFPRYVGLWSRDAIARALAQRRD